MPSLAAGQIDLLVTLYGLPLVRVLGLLAADPLLGSARIPVSIRIATGLVLTMVLVPTLPPPPDVQLSGPQGWVLVAQQFLIGVAIGFVVRLIFTALEVAGEVIGLQMGLGFATLIDPANSTQLPILSSLFTTLGFLFFLAIDGHHLVIIALAESFQAMPPGQWPSSGLFAGIVANASDIFAAGVQIALPLIMMLLFANLALGVMTRAAPQLNIFAVGFTITLGVGLVMLLLQMSHFDAPLLRLFDLHLERLSELVRVGLR